MQVLKWEANQTSVCMLLSNSTQHEEEEIN